MYNAKRFVLVLAAVACLALTVAPGFAQTWDMYTGVTHNEAAVNPNGPWSYGSMTSPTANDFTISTNTFGYAGLFCWTRTYQQFIGKNTVVGWVDDGTFSVPQGWLVMVSNSSVPPGEQTLRWTSPMDGDVYVTATFAGGNYEGGTGVTSNGSIVKNGLVLYTANIVGFAGDYARAAFGSNPSQTIGGAIPVQVGDVIDIVVDTDFDNSGYDHTRLFGSITNVLDMPGTLEGEITLEAYGGDMALAPVKIDLTPQGSGIAQTATITLDANPGQFAVNFAPGTYDVGFTSCKALRKVVQGVVITTDNTTTLPALTLINGDVDGDNVLSIGDAGITLWNENMEGDW